MPLPDPDDLARLTAVEAELATRWPEQQVAPDLSRITALMELLGDPQRSVPVIQVAGTNGKTSTARMIAALLGAFGLRVGLATSPHLDDARERIVLDGRPVDVGRFLSVHDDVAPLIGLVDQRSVAAGGPRMTWFEAMIGLAYACFADAPVDVAVVEVGMGGTWDATNVADAEVAVVTPVGIDHAEYLGGTLEAIAAEKAGIIKPGSVAVLGIHRSSTAAEVLLRRCAEVGAVVAREGLEFGLAGRAVAVGGPAAVAAGARRPLRRRVPAAARGSPGAQRRDRPRGGGVLPRWRRGSPRPRARARGVRLRHVPGRLEPVRTGPTVLVDAAHNPHGARALADAVGESFGFTALFGVVAVLADKDARGLLEALEPVLERVVVTRNVSPRALDVEALAELARAVFGEDRVATAASLADAVDVAVAWADAVLERDGGGAGVLVTGSVVTAAEARRLLRRSSGGGS